MCATICLESCIKMVSLRNLDTSPYLPLFWYYLHQLRPQMFTFSLERISRKIFCIICVEIGNKFTKFHNYALILYCKRYNVWEPQLNHVYRWSKFSISKSTSQFLLIISFFSLLNYDSLLQKQGEFESKQSMPHQDRRLPSIINFGACWIIHFTD